MLPYVSADPIARDRQRALLAEARRHRLARSVRSGWAARSAAAQARSPFGRSAFGHPDPDPPAA